MMLHGRARSLFRGITVSGRRRASSTLFKIIDRLGNGLPKAVRDLPPRSVSTYRADRSAQKIRSVAARQNARLFGYYVSAYGREPGNQIGESRMTRALTRGVNIFILLYPCNSSVANPREPLSFTSASSKTLKPCKVGTVFTSVFRRDNDSR